LLAAAWIGGQATLVLSGARRPDASFAFRMFPESSTISISLSREIKGRGVVHVDAGTWAPWTERVKDPILSNLDLTVSASYGVNAQLFRLQAALDDVASHLEGDSETIRLVADVVVRKNGHDPVMIHLASAPRR
jgi:hypothetical protein